MKTTLALNWKALISKIHPPLPLTPQQSQKLLQRLNAAFQKRLDAEYPFRLEDSNRPTRKHLQSVLGTPLFEAQLSQHRDLPPGINQDGTMSMHGLQYWIRHPLDAFQQGVSAGAATPVTAKLCLELQLKRYGALSGGKYYEPLDTGGTGAAVLSWLWSSGMEESEQHLKDRHLISLLVPFLVIEQRYDVIYNWFSRSGRDNTQTVDKVSQRSQMEQSAFLLLELAKAEKSYGAGLGASMLHFTEYFRRKPKGPPSFGHIIFGPAGNFLTDALAVSGKAATVPEDTLLAFINTSREWAGEGHLADVVLQVHHPQTPRPYAAIQYLERVPLARLNSFKAHQRNAMICTSLKAAELLIADGRDANARWIMDFMQANFAKYVGVKVPNGEVFTLKKRSLAQQEAFHLQLLEPLGAH